MAETTIGQATRVNGTVSGTEEVRVEGEVEGRIELDGALVVEPEGHVRAEVVAADVVVRGTIEGSVCGTRKVEIQPGARMLGDVRTARILISDGAVFRGRVEMDVGEG